jgi:Flp pilus assembly protein TadG
MIRHIFKDQRGTVILFVAVLIVVLLALGGMAIDIFYQTTVDNELQRSLDFAALAGAGKLGFDATAFPFVRTAAQSYAAANPIRKYNGSTVDLDLNATNDPNGHIVLGNWDGSTFTPEPNPPDPTKVNAVRCQFATTIPTSFLRILGVNTLQIAAQATAWGPVPLNAPPDSCVAPIAVTGCQFQDPGGAFNSAGCGLPISFISSSGQDPGTGPASTNTAAWANLGGTDNPSATDTNTAINNAASGTCTAPSVQTGQPINTNNGMQQSVYNNLQDKFITKYNASGIITITNSPSTGNPQETYVGKGWDLYIPVINTGTTCPPGPINGNYTITSWTRFVITQVINGQGQGGGFGANGRCAVSNALDTNSWPYCNDTNLHSSFRGVFGYFSCEFFETLPSPVPGPVTARAEKLQLVK